MKKTTNAIILLIFTAVLFSCSSVHNYNTAIRIKPGKESKYAINPNSSTPRNGNTLRGKVVSVDYVTEPDTCPDFNKLVLRKYVVFIDSANKADQFEERIPVEDIEPMSKMLNLDNDDADTVYFETYNDPLLPKEVKAFPVNKIMRDCSVPCPCGGFAERKAGAPGTALVPGEPPTPFSFKCPQRDLHWWFISAQYTQNFFGDLVENRKYKFLSTYGVDATFGVRLGESYRWNVGLQYSLLPNTYHQLDSLYYHPYVANLYVKYDLIRNRVYKSTKKSNVSSLDQIVQYDTVKTMSYDGFRDSVIVVQKVNTSELLNMTSNSQGDYTEVRPCPNPYIFGGIGLAVDEISRELIGMSSRDTYCGPTLTELVKFSGVDTRYPINFHIGLGLEIPLSSYVDLTLDASYRSLSFGERVWFRAYTFPARKDVDAFVFRIGLNF